MIARDEARCIARCLDSAREHVDEMWVLDTGSVDATAAIARQAGARVVPWAWCDDFSAARNAALALTHCDWRLVLDADEWIDSGADALRGFCQAAPACIGLLQVSSLIDAAQAGVQHAPSWLPRLLPRGVLYQGPCARTAAVGAAAHSGWTCACCMTVTCRSRSAGKSGRNRRLLQMALAQQPDDAYLQYQLGKDFEVQGQHAQAESFYARAYASTEAQAGWRHDLVLRRIYTLKKLARFEPAMALAETEMPHWGHSPDFFFTLGDLLLDWAAAQPQHAPALLPMIESSWLRALDIGENPHLQDTVTGRGSFLAAHNLAVMFSALGDEAKALGWRERSAALREAVSC